MAASLWYLTDLDIQIGMDLSPSGSAGQFNLKVLALT